MMSLSTNCFRVSAQGTILPQPASRLKQATEKSTFGKKEIEKKLLSTEDTIKMLKPKSKSLETRQSAKVSEK